MQSPNASKTGPAEKETNRVLNRERAPTFQMAAFGIWVEPQVKSQVLLTPAHPNGVTMGPMACEKTTANRSAP